MAANLDAWDLWQAVQTQWRAAGMGVIGLDHAWVHKMAGILRIDYTPALFKKMAVLENAAMQKLNKPEAGK